MVAAAAIVERRRAVMQGVRFVCAAWLLPAVFSLVAFFGFFTNYTTDLFSAGGLAVRFERSVFQYRVLGRYFVSTLATVFEPISAGWPVPRAFHLMDPAGTPGTYWAYVVVHTLSTCIGCSLLLVTLRRTFGHTPSSPSVAPELTVVAISMAMALAAYVVTPYDGVFFACQMAAVLITLWTPARAALVPLTVVTILAGLTRESAYFIPMFYLAVHHHAIVAGDRASRAAFSASAAAVVVVYAGLRAILGWSGASSVFYAWQWSSNLKWTSLAGSVMLLASLALLLAKGRHYRERLWFAALSAPYIVFAHVFAEPWELRLWLPVLVPLVVLQFGREAEPR
jgi:hypothetical protein